MRRRLRGSDVGRLVVPEDVAIDPAGQRICFVRRHAQESTDRDVRGLWLIDPSMSAPVELTDGHEPAWSPDGTRLAFLRANQIWCLDIASRTPTRLTDLPAGRPVWSPDGTRIAFRARPADTGSPIVTKRLDYLEGCWHLHVLDVLTGETRRLTDGDWDASDPVWSPDGRTLAFTAAAEPNADVDLTVAAYLIDIDADAEPRLLGPADGRLSGLRWHPDGRSLLAVGRLDTKVGLSQLFRIRTKDGATEQITDADRSVAAPQFVAEGRGVVFCVRDGGDTSLSVLDVESGQVERLTDSGVSVLALSVSDGRAAVILATPDLFGEVAVVDVGTGHVTVQTSLQHDSLPDVELFTRTPRSFTVSDGSTVAGWLLTDPSVPGPKPLLVDVHGGPHNAWDACADRVNLHHQVLAARGWAVLTVNPRGSDGYGESFLTAAIGRWGEADIGDLLEPVDALVAAGIADPGRLAVAGHSYGGYLACYLISHDTRFAAAVVSAPATDLDSLVGTSDQGNHLAVRELGGAGPALGRFSPLDQVDRVTTPTLLLHGTDDVRCPIGQSQQWFAALRRLGVPVEFVRYPGGDHDLAESGRPSHRVDVLDRTVTWLCEHTARPRVVERGRAEADQWQRLLRRLVDVNGVPGAVLGVLREDEVNVVAAGVLNIDTGAPVTPDSVFQIGSITKVWTAAMLLQLCDEGVLDLDRGLAEVLPDLVLAEPDLAGRITPRDLLRHTSGLDGDLYFDTGRGAESVARLVDRLRDVPPLFAPGETWSYSNTGYVVAAHLIERLTGESWDAAIRRRLIDPLGLRSTVTFPEDALLLPTAVGHLDLPGAGITRTPVWGLPRSLAPAGVINSTAGDVLTFARTLMSDGDQVLSPASVAAMRTEQARLPDLFPAADSWGLGLTLSHGYDRPVVGHDGGMIGQAAFLRMIPDSGIAVVLLTNGGHASELFDQLFETIGGQLAGLSRTVPPQPEPTEDDTAHYVGTYRREGKIFEVTPSDRGLHVHVTSTVDLIRQIGRGEDEFDLVPAGAGLFLTQDGGQAAFYRTAAGRMIMHMGLRATPRV
ncbi:serine hydrolase [Actinocrispum wychmicini]|uniref:Dipeptidyl aminopeptidase/acylaminoacyl peptidase n=1 Tax=Actinocrispum wychmicini TaxID=1213861 RepID=A0A4R2J6Q7_9PSEU|nr:serine hydrolase [Actinocrispum wychmicini]TCO54164.1 dipeptidyl aminopeptidase/acylaminoacyl peptidase [Actinocrispum wychmicini]